MAHRLPERGAHADVLFDGPGEARARARAVDWASTPLGPEPTWPEALRVAAQLCMDCPTAVAVWAGADFTLIHNDAYDPFLGSKASWAMGRPAREVWPEVWDQLGPEFAQVFRTGLATRHEDAPYVIGQRGSEEKRYFSFSVSPLRDAAGDVLGLFNVCQETTPAVQAAARLDEELRASENTARRQLAEIQSIYDSAHVGLCVFDRDLRFVRINRRLAEINGVSVEGHLGRTVEDVVPALAPTARDLARRIFSTGEGVTDVEFQGTTASMPGVERTWIEQWLPLADASSAVTGVNVVVEEVTEQRRAEEALRANERRLDVMFRRSPVAMAWVRFPQGIIADVNDAWIELTGIPREEAIGHTAAALGMLPDEERRGHYSTLVAEGTADVEVELTTRGKGVRTVLVRGEVVALGDDRYVLAVLQDVTELRRAEEELRGEQARLEQADRRKTEFIAVLSHELRNPLAPIRNSIVLLDAAPADSTVAARARDVLRRQTEHLVRLVDDLLDVSRITHGKVQLQLAVTDVRELIRRAYFDAKGLFDARAIELLLSDSLDPLWVAVDGARFSQMVGNLLHNALKFTPPRGRVELKVVRRGGTCEVRVRDSGQGLDGADLEKIFDPFHQALRSREGGGGLGLGLALVKGLAEKHGGSAAARSEGRGKGAEFVITLPLADPPASERGGPTAPAYHGAPLRVLIVEDNEDAAATLADLLALGGHRVTIAGTGAAGVAAVRAERPDVLICDVGLPDMSGHDVMRAIRAEEDGPRLFATALTGYAQPEDREAALAAGFDAHLPKPPPLEALEALLERAGRAGTKPTSA